MRFTHFSDYPIFRILAEWHITGQELMRHSRSFEFWILSFSVDELLVFCDRKPGDKVLKRRLYVVQSV